MPPAGHSAASGPGHEGRGSWELVKPTSSQEPSVPLSCSRAMEPSPLPKKERFSFQKLLFGMFNVFHQNHKPVLFSSHFYDVSNGSFEHWDIVTDGCSWKINKELNQEQGESCLLRWLYQWLKHFSFHHTVLYRHCQIWELCEFTFPTWKHLWPDTAPRTSNILCLWLSPCGSPPTKDHHLQGRVVRLQGQSRSSLKATARAFP